VITQPDTSVGQAVLRKSAASSNIRIHHHDFIHLPDRQQRAVGPAVSRLATPRPARERGLRARRRLGWIRRRGARRIG
jgi:hypothetical protein